MGCEYCNSAKRNKSIAHNSCSSVSIGKDDGVYRIYYSDGYGWKATEPILFCPMCGERFPEVVKDSLKIIREDMALDVCEYTKKRGIRRENNSGLSNCEHCEWRTSNEICNRLMVDDLADRLGKLLDGDDER